MCAAATLRNFCYVLINDKDHKTYNGFTNNPARRLRQHNCEIGGGAKFTTRQVKKDGDVPRNWEYLVLIDAPGMTQQQALSLEWHIKHPTNRRRRPREFNGANGRLASLIPVLANPKFSGFRFRVRVLDRYFERAKTLFAKGCAPVVAGPSVVHGASENKGEHNYVDGGGSGNPDLKNERGTDDHASRAEGDFAPKQKRRSNSSSSFSNAVPEPSLLLSAGRYPSPRPQTPSEEERNVETAADDSGKQDVDRFWSCRHLPLPTTFLLRDHASVVLEPMRSDLHDDAAHLAPETDELLAARPRDQENEIDSRTMSCDVLVKHDSPTTTHVVDELDESDLCDDGHAKKSD